MNPNGNMTESIKSVFVYSGIPATSTTPYVSLLDCSKVSIKLICENATTVTGVAVSLLQATAVAGTSAKALAFSQVTQDLDCAASAVQTIATVSSNTFNTDTTNSKRLLYIIDIDPATLDVNNGFDCVAVLLTGSAAAQTIQVVFELWPARYKTPIGANPLLDNN